MPFRCLPHSLDEQTTRMLRSDVEVTEAVCWWSAQADEDFYHSIILDSAIRRFQCQRAYLRAHAALRWMNSRNAVLRGQKAHAGHFQALQAIDNTLRIVRTLRKPIFITPLDESGVTLQP